MNRKTAVCINCADKSGNPRHPERLLILLLTGNLFKTSIRAQEPLCDYVVLAVLYFYYKSYCLFHQFAGSVCHCGPQSRSRSDPRVKGHLATPPLLQLISRCQHQRSRLVLKYRQVSRGGLSDCFSFRKYSKL